MKERSTSFATVYRLYIEKSATSISYLARKSLSISSSSKISSPSSSDILYLFI